MQKDLERLESKINKKENGCWEFTGFKDKDGYGNFYLDRKKDKFLKFKINNICI